jgi:hypothetical protein
MADKITIRRGSTAARVAETPSLGEPFWDTTLKRLFVGDGATAGGIVADGLAGNLADVNVAAAADATLLGIARFSLAARKIVAGAGSGAYTAKYSLAVADMREGAVVDLNVELAASANPTVEIYNGTSGGTLLATMANPAPAGAAYWYGRFRFDGNAWHCLFRAWQS